MIKNIEEMHIWQLSRVLVNEIYDLMKDCKDWGFRNQIQRAAISIMNNIAEGFESGSNGKFIYYLKISRGSCSEVNSMLFLCEDFKLCDIKKRIKMQDTIKLISSGCFNLIKSLERKRD